jgi:hypothetical protein
LASVGWLSMMLSGLATEPWLTEMVKLGSGPEPLRGSTDMSTEAQASTPTKRSVPLYKRRRRRLYGAAALALAIVIGVVVWATTGGSGPEPLPSFTISVSQGSVASPDSIIESQPTLAKLPRS